MKYQAILKTGGYGSRLYSSPMDAMRSIGASNISTLVEVHEMNFEGSDGKNNSRGKMFASRKGGNNNARRNFR